MIATGSAGALAFDDQSSVRLALGQATYILSSVPPLVDGDPVLATYGDAIRHSPAIWRGYLSSTGVYGDCGGAWVDESALLKGRRASRNQVDRDWQRAGAHVFRLPGIYGPGRSAFERIAEGRAHRIDLPDQVFSRIHVDDIAAGVIAAFDAPPGVYNLADDVPAPNNHVIEKACALMGVAPPPLQSLEQANLSREALAFYSENRRVANGKAKRVLGWKPAYPSFVEGLARLKATTIPASVTTAPSTPDAVQR